MSEKMPGAQGTPDEILEAEKMMTPAMEETSNDRVELLKKMEEQGVVSVERADNGKALPGQEKESNPLIFKGVLVDKKGIKHEVTVSVGQRDLGEKRYYSDYRYFKLDEISVGEEIGKKLVAKFDGIDFSEHNKETKDKVDKEMYAEKSRLYEIKRREEMEKVKNIMNDLGLEMEERVESE